MFVYFILTEEEEEGGQRKKQKRKNMNLGKRGMFSKSRRGKVRKGCDHGTL